MGDKKRVFLIALTSVFIIQICLHWFVFPLPALGQQTWRQIVGYAAARNFFLEDMSFFNPRADIRLFPGDLGQVYHELPLTYWVSAVGYSIFGVQNWIPRIVAFCFNFLLIPGAYVFLRELNFSRKSSYLGAYFAAFSPWFLYYSVSTEPNILALSFFLLGSGLLFRAFRENSYNANYLMGIFCLVVATHCKITYLLYGLPIGIFLILTRSTRSWRDIGRFACLPLLLIAVSHSMTFHHAHELYQKSPWERAIHTPFGVGEAPQSLTQIWRNVRIAFTNWLFEIYVNFAAIPFFVIGLWFFCQKQTTGSSYTRGSKIFFSAWMLTFLFYCSLFVTRLGDHDYYTSSVYPLVLASSTFGATWCLGQPKLKPIAMILILLYPITGFERIKGRWFDVPEVPAELLYHGKDISEIIPKDELLLVSGDKSPIIYLYYLERKGFSISTYDDIHQSQYLQNFHWLIHDRSKGAIRKDVGEIYDLSLAAQKFQFDIYRIHLRR